MKEASKEDIKINLISCSKVIGLKQVVKHAQRKELKVIYLASDVDQTVGDRVLAIAGENDIPVEPVVTKQKLGQYCGIEVGAACVGILNG